MIKAVTHLAYHTLIVFLLMTGTLQLHAQNQPEVSVRGGLPWFAAKALKGDTLRVAYLGGSITEQPGWRVYSLKWLREQYPATIFIEINAAIGGTGSDFGAFRLGKHVLEFKPDLLFVEFAVNDDGKQPSGIERSMEGIVRQSKNFNSQMDICLIYTIKQDFMEVMGFGKQPESIRVMEQVAKHYNLPSINFGVEVARQVNQGQLIMTSKERNQDGKRVFSPDGVHPYPETGHRIYHQVFERSFSTILANSTQGPVAAAMPPAYREGSYLKVMLVYPAELPILEGWNRTAIASDPRFNRVNRLIEHTYRAETPCASLAFQFRGTAVGVCDLLGPGSGRVVVDIDGVVTDTLRRFDAYSTYWRLNYFLIENLEDTLHTVKFIPLEQPFDKMTIPGIDAKKLMNNPDSGSYKWYPCGILVNGTITGGGMTT